MRLSYNRVFLLYASPFGNGAIERSVYHFVVLDKWINVSIVETYCITVIELADIAL